MDIPDDHTGVQTNPHIESFDSEYSATESDSGSSDSEVEVHETRYVDNSEASCFVAANSVKYLTPKCEELYKPQINQYFPSLKDAFLFYKEYGRLCGFDVRKSTKRSDRRENLYAKHIQCNRGGCPVVNKPKDGGDFLVEGSSKKTTSKRCNCKAQIVMKPAGPRGFVLMSFAEEHNYPLTFGTNRIFLRCNRHVSIAHQQFIMDCSRDNIGVTRAHNLVKKMTGSYEDVGATIADFKNFTRDVKVHIGDHDTDMVLAKFKLKKETSNNSFYYDYKVDKDDHLTGLFWTDAVGQANYDVFGDIVSFDPTFRTNRYNLVFVPFTDVDNHWKNVRFAAGLLAKENYKNFKWIINAFKKSMGRTPSCVIKDHYRAIKKALSKWWRSTKHRLCMRHIMNKLPSKVGPKLVVNKKFVDKLKSVVYPDHLTPSDFEERWNSVISEYKLDRNSWLSEMYSIREEWIPAYFPDIEMADLLRTTSRSESSNFFQHYHESGDTLIEFYSSFESAMDKKCLRTAEDEKRSQQILLMDTSLSIEVHASQVYTLELYYLIRDEIKSGYFHTILEEISSNEEFHHFKFKDELLNEQNFEVSVRHCDNHLTCSCKFYYRREYLCHHAFAALHQCGVKKIPQEYVKARWTKNAIRNHSLLGSVEEFGDCTKRDCTKLKRTRAWFEFHHCMTLLGDDEAIMDYVNAELKSLNYALVEKLGSTTKDASLHRADKFIRPSPTSEISVRNPNISRNKGCGSRLKSGREISIEPQGARKCSKCHKVARHNARTCPFEKNSSTQ